MDLTNKIWFYEVKEIGFLLLLLFLRLILNPIFLNLKKFEFILFATFEGGGSSDCVLCEHED